MRFISIITALVILIFAIIQFGLDLIEFFLNGKWQLESFEAATNRIFPFLLGNLRPINDDGTLNSIWTLFDQYALKQSSALVLFSLSVLIFLLVYLFRKREKQKLSDFFY